jgi:hypothetical protein
VGHFAVAGANFDPNFVPVARKSGKDPLLPASACKKMLSHPLSRHGEGEFSKFSAKPAALCAGRTDFGGLP